MKISTFLVQLDIASKAGETGNFEKTLADLHSKGLDMMDLYTGLTSAHDPGELSGQLKRSGIGISSMYHLFEFSYDRENILSLMKEDSKKRLELCAFMGSDIFMPVPAITKPYESANGRSECAKIVSQYIGDICFLAKQYNITVVIENFSDNKCPFATFSDIDRLLCDNPGLYFVLDSGNFWFNGIDACEAIERYCDKIKHVHFKDITPSETGSILINGKTCDSNDIGSGVIDFAKIIKMLREKGYDDSVSIEINTTDNLIKKTELSLEFLKKLI